MKRSSLGWLLVAALVGGCAPTTPVLGLRPQHPAPHMQEFVKLDTRRPTLQWEEFARAADRESDTRLAAIQDVTYDLRVWRAGPDDYPGHLVYARDALPETRHTVNTDLEPDVRYLWTVRARFSLGGRTRVTPWSTLDVFPASRATVPDPAYFRFRTPAQ